MPYTERQQQLLTAMGIVPWVQRAIGSDLALPTTQEDVTPAPAATPAPAFATASATAFATASDNGLAFAAKPLCTLSMGLSIGHAEAPLLVVVETHELLLNAPLTGHAAQLFEQMMRSIDVTRSAVCQCAVPAGGDPAESGQATVSSLVSLHRAVGILLSHEVDDVEDASAHAFELPIIGRNALPMWRIPHPDVLLLHPLRKRQAWQALKAVRRTLQP